jgi:hypothetical protein
VLVHVVAYLVGLVNLVLVGLIKNVAVVELVLCDKGMHSFIKC